MKTRSRQYSYHERPGPFGRFRPAYPVDDPAHLAQIMFVSKMRVAGHIGGGSAGYNSEHEQLLYTTRAIASPTTGMCLPFETPVYIAWSDLNIIADVGIELEDDCIEARFVRDSRDRGSWYNPASAIEVAAHGLSLVLRGEYNTPMMHQALDEEVERLRVLEKNSVRSRAQLFARSPIADWWKERGVTQEPETSKWDGDYYEPHHWSHFRRPYTEPSTSELEKPPKEEPQFQQPPVTKVRSELGYRVAKLLGTHERIRD